MAKYTSPYSGERIDHSVKAIPDTNPKEESILVISKAGEGSYKKVSEVGATVVQETGDSETQVMSQDATTKELNKKTDKGYLANEHLLKWDAIGNKIVDTGKTTADFVPKIVHPTEYRMYCQRPSGAAVNPGGIEMIRYSSVAFENSIAYRDEYGVIKGKTAELAKQSNRDLINRGELTEKLGEVGGGLKWVDYSAEIPRVNVYAVIVGLGNIGHDDGTTRCPLPPILTFDGNLMMGGIKYPYDLYREDFFKTGGKGTFYLTKSGVGYAQQATLENQVKADGASYDWNVCEIMKMLVKE